MSSQNSLEIIHNAAKDRYKFEIERIKLLDDKANNLVGVSSVLAALISGFAVLSVKLSNPTIAEAVAFFLFLACLGLLVASLGFSMKAYQIRSYVIVPDTPSLIVECEKMKADRIFEVLYINYALATNENEKKNEDKVSYVRLASRLLLGAVVLFAIFVFISIAKG